MTTILLQTRDGQIFNVDSEPMLYSGLIRRRLLGVEPADYADTVVPLVLVDSNILIKICDWAKYHYDNYLVDDVDMPYSAFEMLSYEHLNTIHQMARAAMYMDIRGLARVAITIVFCVIQNMTTEEICAMVDELFSSNGERLEPDTN